MVHYASETLGERMAEVRGSVKELKGEDMINASGPRLLEKVSLFVTEWKTQSESYRQIEEYFHKELLFLYGSATDLEDNSSLWAPI